MDTAMRILISLICLALIISFPGCLSKREVIMGIKLKKSKGKILQLDDNIWETYYQYHDQRGNFQFGELVTGTRNDTIFITGSKIVEKDFILIKEIYYHNIAKYDSIQKKFVKTEDNKITLKEIREYKDGKIIQEKLF